MIKVYRIYRIENQRVCIDSDDYYRKDWVSTELHTLDLLCEFDSEEEALEGLNDLYGQYVILPVYINK